MAEPDDPDLLPTQTWAASSETEPAPEIRLGAAFVPSAGHKRWQAPTPEEVQRSFPQYEIVEILGRGGMGAVYKGWQKSLHRFVAIKILPPDIEGETTNYAERFQREARAMARFQHPCIVAVHDAGETPEGLLYFVMEYIEGTDVQKMVASSGKLAPDHALGIALQVCDALAYAHTHGVIHRDIKPSNIMMERNGMVKVADFGLAKLTTEDSSLLTGSHITMGTPDFMAPEALSGMENVDHRADIYAVGVMLYQMLTGEVPRGRFDLPSAHTPGLDTRFDAIVDRAMQKNPDRRYSSAIELRSDLQSIRGGSAVNVSTSAPAAPVAASPSSTGADPNSEAGLSEPTAGKRRGRLLASLIAGICAVTASAIFLTQRNTKSAAGAPPAAADAGSALATATKEHAFENSLGMKFVPVPVSRGPGVLFSIWETRVQDYQPFVEEQGVEWPKPHFEEPTQPAVNVTWNEARAFCVWLTEREHRNGRLLATERYRLPTDHEWSCAVGLGERENPADTPEQKHMRIGNVFPWGTAWPPPAGAGNYSGEEAKDNQTWTGQKILPGYRDGFPEIAPVGSFQANRLGIFDLGGNAHEWCEDLFRPDVQAAVLRGASFVNESRENLMSSYRLSRPFDTRSRGNGFRVVLAGASSAPAADH